MKAATRIEQFEHYPKYISIHAAREGGDYKLVEAGVNLVISIHAAREGGDLKLTMVAYTKRDFNPRRP